MNKVWNEKCSLIENKENNGDCNGRANDIVYQLHQEIVELKARVAVLERMCKLHNREDDKEVIEKIPEALFEEDKMKEEKRNSIEKSEVDASEAEIDPDSLKEALTEYINRTSKIVQVKQYKNEVKKLSDTLQLEISNMIQLKAKWKKEEECLNKLQAQRGFLQIAELNKEFGGFLIKLPNSSKEHIFIEPCCIRKSIISFNTEEVSHTLLAKLLMNKSAKMEVTLDYLVRYSKSVFLCLFGEGYIRLAKLLAEQHEVNEKFEVMYNIQDEYFAVTKRILEMVPKTIVSDYSKVERINECTEIMVCEIGRTRKKVIHLRMMQLDFVFILDNFTEEVIDIMNKLSKIKNAHDVEEIALELIKCKDLKPGIAFYDEYSQTWEWRDIKLLKTCPFN